MDFLMCSWKKKTTSWRSLLKQIVVFSLIYSLGAEMANHYWTFDQVDTIKTIVDEVTNQRVNANNSEGTGHRYFTIFPTSSRKKYISFQGNNLKLNLGSYQDCIGDIASCPNGFTLTLWLRVRTRDGMKSQQLISSNSRNKGMKLKMNNNLFTVTLANQVTLNSASYAPGIRQWHQHTFVWNGSSISVFVDGKRVRCVYKTEAIPSASGVGAFVLGGDGFNDVDFDDIFVWYRILSDDDIFEGYRSVVDDLVVYGCTSTPSQVCVKRTPRQDFYNLIVSETIRYLQRRTKDIHEEDIGAIGYRKCRNKLGSLEEFEISMVTKFRDGRSVTSNKVTCKTTDGLPRSPSRISFSDLESNELTASWTEPPTPNNGSIIYQMLELFQLETSPINAGLRKQVRAVRVKRDTRKWKLKGLYSNTLYQASISSVSKVGKGRPTFSKIKRTLSEELSENVSVSVVSDTELIITWNTTSPRKHRIYFRTLDGVSSYIESTSSLVVVSGLKALSYYYIDVLAFVRGSYKSVLETEMMAKTQDPKECADASTNDCDALANCTDTEASFFCTCPQGFFGDGKVCQRIPRFASSTFFCTSERYRNIDWPRMYGGNTATVSCPVGTYGHATRRCLAPTVKRPAVYARPDLSRCVTIALKELEYKVLDTRTNMTKVLNEVNDIVGSINNPYGGDIKLSLVYIRKLMTRKVNEQELIINLGMKLTELSSMLLDGKAVVAWHDIPAEGRRVTAETMVTTMEELAVMIVLNFDSNEFHAVHKNIELKVQSPVSDAVLQTYGENGSLQYSIQIPRDDPVVLGLNKSSPLIMSKCNNIGSLLQEPNGNISISSSVMSATFFQKKVTFQKPVEISIPNPKGFEISNPNCVFWNSSARDGFGDWSSEGCELHNVTHTHTVCYCYHLTNFAILMTLTPHAAHAISTGSNAYALTLITYIGLIVSIIALTVALLSFLCFKFLKSKRVVCHSHLALALLLANITFLLGIELTGNRGVCQAVAVLLEYFYLTAFLWMAVEGVLLYFMLRKIFKEVNLFKKRGFHVACWVLPAAYTLVFYGIFPHYYGTPRYCWLSTNSGFVWTFVLPVLIVILFNLSIMVLSFYTMSKRSKEENSISQQLWYWVKACFILTCILGVTWLFGLLHFDSSSLVFAYIFAIFNTLQGLLIFIFHCLIDSKVRQEYLRLLKCEGRAKFNEKNSMTNYFRVTLTSSTSSNKTSPTPQRNTSEKLWTKQHSSLKAEHESNSCDDSGYRSGLQNTVDSPKFGVNGDGSPVFQYTKIKEGCFETPLCAEEVQPLHQECTLSVCETEEESRFSFNEDVIKGIEQNERSGNAVVASFVHDQKFNRKDLFTPSEFTTVSSYNSSRESLIDSLEKDIARIKNSSDALLTPLTPLSATVFTSSEEELGERGVVGGGAGGGEGGLGGETIVSHPLQQSGLNTDEHVQDEEDLQALLLSVIEEPEDELSQMHVRLPLSEHIITPPFTPPFAKRTLQLSQFSNSTSMEVSEETLTTLATVCELFSASPECSYLSTTPDIIAEKDHIVDSDDNEEYLSGTDNDECDDECEEEDDETDDDLSEELIDIDDDDEDEDEDEFDYNVINRRLFSPLPTSSTPASNLSSRASNFSSENSPVPWNPGRCESSLGIEINMDETTDKSIELEQMLPIISDAKEGSKEYEVTEEHFSILTRAEEEERKVEEVLQYRIETPYLTEGDIEQHTLITKDGEIESELDANCNFQTTECAEKDTKDQFSAQEDNRVQEDSDVSETTTNMDFSQEQADIQEPLEGTISDHHLVQMQNDDDAELRKFIKDTYDQMMRDARDKDTKHDVEMEDDLSNDRMKHKDDILIQIMALDELKEINESMMLQTVNQSSHVCRETEIVMKEEIQDHVLDENTDMEVDSNIEGHESLRDYAEQEEGNITEIDEQSPHETGGDKIEIGKEETNVNKGSEQEHCSQLLKEAEDFEKEHLEENFGLHKQESKNEEGDGFLPNDKFTKKTSVEEEEIELQVEEMVEKENDGDSCLADTSLYVTKAKENVNEELIGIQVDDKTAVLEDMWNSFLDSISTIESREVSTCVSRDGADVEGNVATPDESCNISVSKIDKKVVSDNTLLLQLSPRRIEPTEDNKFEYENEEYVLSVSKADQGKVTGNQERSVEESITVNDKTNKNEEEVETHPVDSDATTSCPVSPKESKPQVQTGKFSPVSLCIKDGEIDNYPPQSVSVDDMSRSENNEAAKDEHTADVEHKILIPKDLTKDVLRLHHETNENQTETEQSVTTTKQPGTIDVKEPISTEVAEEISEFVDEKKSISDDRVKDMFSLLNETLEGFEKSVKEEKKEISQQEVVADPLNNDENTKENVNEDEVVTGISSRRERFQRALLKSKAVSAFSAPYSRWKKEDVSSTDSESKIKGRQDRFQKVLEKNKAMTKCIKPTDIEESQMNKKSRDKNNDVSKPNDPVADDNELSLLEDHKPDRKGDGSSATQDTTNLCDNKSLSEEEKVLSLSNDGASIKYDDLSSNDSCKDVKSHTEDDDAVTSKSPSNEDDVQISPDRDISSKSFISDKEECLEVDHDNLVEKNANDLESKEGDFVAITTISPKDNVTERSCDVDTIEDLEASVNDGNSVNSNIDFLEEEREDKLPNVEEKQRISETAEEETVEIGFEEKEAVLEHIWNAFLDYVIGEKPVDVSSSEKVEKPIKEDNQTSKLSLQSEIPQDSNCSNIEPSLDADGQTAIKSTESTETIDEPVATSCLNDEVFTTTVSHLANEITTEMINDKTFVKDLMNEEDEQLTDKEPYERSESDEEELQSRLSIPSKIMHDIADILSSLSPGMENDMPSPRERVRLKPKVRSRLSSFDEESAPSSPFLRRRNVIEDDKEGAPSSPFARRRKVIKDDDIALNYLDEEQAKLQMEPEHKPIRTSEDAATVPISTNNTTYVTPSDEIMLPNKEKVSADSVEALLNPQSFRASIIFKEIEEIIRRDQEAIAASKRSRMSPTKSKSKDELHRNSTICEKTDTKSAKEKRRSKSEPKLLKWTKTDSSATYRSELEILQYMPGDSVIGSPTQRRLKHSISATPSTNSSSSVSSCSDDVSS